MRRSRALASCELLPLPGGRTWNSDGTSATLISTPCGTVFGSNGQQSGIGVAVDPTSGTVLTAKPTALVFSADGVTPHPVTDFQAFLPVNTGALATAWPASSYYVDGFTPSWGLERTKTHQRATTGATTPTRQT